MKYTYIALFLFLGLLGCVENDFNPTIDSTESTDSPLQRQVTGDPFLQNDRLVFATEEDFENYIINHSYSEISTFLNGLEFSSLNASSWLESKEETDNEEALKLTALINANGLIEIHHHLIKMDFVNEKIYAIDNAVSTQLLDDFIQANEFSAYPEGTLFFDFTDEVFAAINPDADVDEDDPEFWGCGENCASGDKDKENPNYCTNENGTRFKFTIVVKYIRVGIYNWLRMEFHHKCNKNCSEVSDDVPYDITYLASWKRKCRSGGAARFDYHPTLSYRFTGNKWTRTFYNGTRCLSSYDLIGQARFAGACNPTRITTRFMEVRG